MRLPVSALPQVDFPTIVVTTHYPGAGPDTMSTLVTAPLERQLGQINGIESMQSSSAVGVSEITLQFDLTRSMDGAAQDVQAAINSAQGVLPSTLPYPPTYNRVNPADAPIVSLAVTSDTLPVDQLADAADTLLQPKLSQIDGVGPCGGARRAEAGDTCADSTRPGWPPTGCRWRMCVRRDHQRQCQRCERQFRRPACLLRGRHE